jgi:hypothetical protein
MCSCRSERLQAYFNRPDVAQAVEVYLDDPGLVGDMRAPIEEAAGAAGVFDRLAAAQRDLLLRA